jgi:hypothetical protein
VPVPSHPKNLARNPGKNRRCEVSGSSHSQ